MAGTDAGALDIFQLFEVQNADLTKFRTTVSQVYPIRYFGNFSNKFNGIWRTGCPPNY